METGLTAFVIICRMAGFETIMMNCNPETVSTDYDTSSRLYFEPITLEDVLNVIDVERPEGIIVSFGGQTPLKISTALDKALKENPIPAASGETAFPPALVNDAHTFFASMDPTPTQYV
jgi:hypothetical protein